VGRRYGRLYLACQAWNKAQHGVLIATPETHSRHNDRVRQIVPEQHLLGLQSADGWELLCRFLRAGCTRRGNSKVVGYGGDECEDSEVGRVGDFVVGDIVFRRVLDR